MKNKTTFTEWLRAYGKQRAIIDLNITERTFYYWLDPKGKVKPGPANAEKILALAPHLSLSDIMGIGPRSA